MNQEQGGKSWTEYPIFPKTYDLVCWLLQSTLNFPKSQRFVLAKRVQDTVLEFYELLIEARKVPPGPRQAVLLRADVKLESLRLLLRMCHELQLFSSGQYRHVSKLVTEVGKLLGVWRKGRKAKTSNRGR